MQDRSLFGLFVVGLVGWLVGFLLIQLAFFLLLLFFKEAKGKRTTKPHMKRKFSELRSEAFEC